MRAAVDALRQQGPKQIVVAVPVGSRDTCSAMRRVSDVLTVCAETPEPFYSVGVWYEDFSQTTDDEVHDLLSRAAGFTDAAARQGKEAALCRKQNPNALPNDRR